MGITCPDLRFYLKNGIDYDKERSSPRCKRLTSIPRHSPCREAGRKGEVKSLDRGPPQRLPRWRRRWPASPVTYISIFFLTRKLFRNYHSCTNMIDTFLTM